MPGMLKGVPGIQARPHMDIIEALVLLSVIYDNVYKDTYKKKGWVYIWLRLLWLDVMAVWGR